MHRLSLLPLASLLVLVGGCSRPTARIHGKVTYQSRPVAGAVVSFIGSDNQVYRTATASDGQYEVAGVPQGAVSVSIQLEPPRPAPRPQPGKGPDPFAMKEQAAEDIAKASRKIVSPPQAGGMSKGPARLELPARYADPKQSGLARDIASPDVEWPLDLQ